MRICDASKNKNNVVNQTLTMLHVMSRNYNRGEGSAHSLHKFAKISLKPALVLIFSENQSLFSIAVKILTLLFWNINTFMTNKTRIK